jgi:ABC-type multidrug transport system ATPase subunit
MQVGYVPEDAPLYDGMRVAEFLRFMAAIIGQWGSRLALSQESRSSEGDGRLP